MSGILEYSFNGHVYKFEHVNCRCSGHCNDDNFWVDDIKYPINNCNSSLCYMMESMFEGTVYKIVPDGENRYKIFLEFEDYERTEYYLLWKTLNQTLYVADIPRDVWEVLPPYDDETYYSPIWISEYGDFLEGYCKHFIDLKKIMEKYD